MNLTIEEKVILNLLRSKDSQKLTVIVKDRSLIRCEIEEEIQGDIRYEQNSSNVISLCC